MKKITLLFLFLAAVGYSQTKGISYQALILDPTEQQLPGFNNDKVPLANKNICLQFSIIDENTNDEYVENHVITTDEFGMVNLTIGLGEVTGGYANSFEDILWNTLPKSLRVAISMNNSCEDFTEISNAPFTAIPFALFALKTQSIISTLADGRILLGDTNGNAREVTLTGDVALDNTGAVTIADDAVTTAKLANIPQGAILVGGVSNAPTVYDAKTDGQILVGNGTDITSVAVTGDIALENTGAVTIADDAVTTAKLANITRGSILVGGVSNAPSPLNAKTDGQILVGNGTDITSVALTGDVALDNTGAVTIADDAVTTAKLANITQGSILVGGAFNAPTVYDAKTDGQILVGNGTDITSVALTGDVVLENTGAVTIADDAVTTAKLANITQGAILVGGAFNAPTVYDAKTDGQILVGNGTDITSVAVTGDVALDNTGAVTIADDAVTTAKLANITRGAILVGGVSNAPSPLNAKTDGQILVGNGTDITSVAVTGDVALDNTGAVTIADDAVTTAKLANITRGSILVGGVSNAPSPLNAKTDGQILVGNGTDITSVAVTGDVALDNTGAVTIADDAVTTAKLANITRGSILVGGVSNAPSPLNAKTDGQILVGNGTDITSVAVTGDVVLENTGAVTIADDAVTTAKLANITRGAILVGGVSNAPSPLNAKTDGQILVGNGTDITSVAVTGDVALDNTGAVTIADDAVTTAKLANITRGAILVGGAFNAPTVYDAKTDGQILVGNGTDITSVAVTGDVALDNTGTVTIADDAVTTAKLANITRGAILVGGVSNAPTVYDAKTDGQILVGNGTDITSVAVTGDVVLENTGAVTIADDAVTTAKLANITRGAILVGGVSNAPSPLNAKTDGQILVGNGTDITSVALTGDVVLENTGAVTIADDAVTTAKLANITRGAILVGGAFNAPTVYDAKTDGQILVGNGTDITSVAVTGDVVLDNTGTVTIADDAVTTAKLANITRGAILVGGVSNAPTVYDAKTDGQILVGNGTDITSVAVTGDVVLDNTGAVTIADDAVTTAKLANITRGSILVGGAFNAPSPLNAKTDGQILVGNGTDITSVAVTGDVALENTGAVTIADDAVTTAKLANITRGSILVGGVSNAPSPLNAKTDGQILVGNGTDITSVAVTGDVVLDNTGAVTIADDAVTTAKLANITRGSILVGGAFNAPSPLNAKTDGQILVGNGTDITSVAVTGDVALDNTGAVTIADDAVTTAKLANITRGSILVGGAFNAPSPLNAKTDGQILVGNGTDITSVAVTGDVALDNTGAATIADDAVTTAKLANITRGAILVGGVSNAPTVYDAKTDGQILVGNGTDITSVAVTGDVALDNTGAATIADDAVTTAKLANITRGAILVGGVSNAPTVYDAKTDGQILVGNGTDITSVAVTGDVALDNTGAVTIADDAVTTAKLANITRGAILVGGVSNAPTVYDAKTDGQILVGNGTDITSVAVTGDVALDNTGAATIADDAVTTAKLANITRGSILVGGVSNAPSPLNAKTDGQILVGNGTDITSVAVTGDVVLDNTGAVTIADDAVTTAKLANITRGSILVGGAFNAPSPLNAKTDGQILVGNGTDITSVAVTGDVALDNTGAVTIADDAVTTAKLANITRGAILVGGVSNAPTVYDAKTDGQILVGNGTDITSVAVTGDVVLENTGAVTIADDAVTTAKLANITQGSILVGGVSNAPTVYDAKTDGQILVGNGTDITSVAVTGDVALDNTGTVTIADDAVTTAKLANITQGSILVGGVSNAPTVYDAKTDGQILVGNGTDITSVAVTGDVALDNTGAVTIADDAVTTAKLANITRGAILVGGVSNAPSPLNAKTDGQILVGNGTDITSVAVTGDVALDNTGAVTIADDAVTTAKLANITRGAILVGGVSNAPTVYDAKTDGQILVGNGTDITSVAVTGDVALDNTGAVTIADDAVTNAKIANATINLTSKVTGALQIQNGGTGGNTNLSARTNLGIISGSVILDGTSSTIVTSVVGVDTSYIVTATFSVNSSQKYIITAIANNNGTITIKTSGLPVNGDRISFIAIDSD